MNEPPPSTATTRTAAATSLAAPSMIEPAEPVAAAPSPEQTPAVAYVEKDAAAGRAFVTPTAMTNPKGSFSVELAMPALPVGGMGTVRFSITDRIEIGIGGFASIVDEEDEIAFGLFSAKAQVWRRPTGAVSVQAQYAKTADDYDDDAILLTAIGSKCFGDGCRTLLTGHVTFVPHTTYHVDDSGNGADQGALAVIPGFSLVHGRRIKLVLDGAIIGDDFERLAALYGGVRFARKRWAFDAGVVVGAADGDVEAVPVPFGSLTGRF